MDNNLESFLQQYDDPQQETKRAIGRFLYDQPRSKHTPSEIHRAIGVDVTQGTVENNLSELKDQTDIISQDQQTVYSWEGEGRPKSLRETLGDFRQSLLRPSLRNDSAGPSFRLFLQSSYSEQGF